MLAPVSKGKIPASPPAGGAAAGMAPDNVECSGGGQNSGAAGKAEREISIFYKGGLAVLPAAQCKICGLICEKNIPKRRMDENLRARMAAHLKYLRKTTLNYFLCIFKKILYPISMFGD